MMTSHWIDVKERLPKDGEMVLGFMPNRYVWGHGGLHRDREVVIFEKLKYPNWAKDRDGNIIETSGNNLLPYVWHGSHQFFGQEVTHWMPLYPFCLER